MAAMRIRIAAGLRRQLEVGHLCGSSGHDTQSWLAVHLPGEAAHMRVS